MMEQPRKRNILKMMRDQLRYKRRTPEEQKIHKHIKPPRKRKKTWKKKK